MTSNIPGRQRCFAVSDEMFQIGAAVRAGGGTPFLVGGWVRDRLLGLNPGKDFDVEVFGLEAKPLQKILKAFGPVHAVGRHFGILKLVTAEAEYDIGLPRRENKTGKGHKGFLVHTDPGMTFEEAASRRDFTINAMGFGFLDEDFRDPFGGESDLNAGVLRHLGSAFGEDPLRVLRALQFAGRFGMTVAPETVAICREQDLGELPRERIWEEFRKLLLAAPAPSAGLKYAAPLGVLPYFPELEALAAAKPSQPDQTAPWDITMAVVDEAAQLRGGEQRQDMILMLAALCHRMNQPMDPPAEAMAEAGPENARRFLERLTNMPDVIGGVLTLIRELHQPERLFAAQGETADRELRWLSGRISPPFLEKLARARHKARERGMGAAAPFAAGEWFLARAGALGVLEGPPRPFLGGDDLKKMGFRQGRALGKFLKQAYALQMEGKLAGRRESLRWAEARVAEQPELRQEKTGGTP